MSEEDYGGWSELSVGSPVRSRDDENSEDDGRFQKRRKTETRGDVVELAKERGFPAIQTLIAEFIANEDWEHLAGLINFDPELQQILPPADTPAGLRARLYRHSDPILKDVWVEVINFDTRNRWQSILQNLLDADLMPERFLILIISDIGTHIRKDLLSSLRYPENFLTELAEIGRKNWEKIDTARINIERHVMLIKLGIIPTRYVNEISRPGYNPYHSGFFSIFPKLFHWFERAPSPESVKDEYGYYKDEYEANLNYVYELASNPNVRISGINIDGRTFSYNDYTFDNLPLRMKSAFLRGLQERRTRLLKSKSPWPIDVLRNIYLRRDILRLCEYQELETDEKIERYETLSQLLREQMHIPLAEFEKYRFEDRCRFLLDVATLGPMWNEKVARKIEERQTARKAMHHLKQAIGQMRNLGLPVDEYEKELLRLQGIYTVGMEAFLWKPPPKKNL
jgi:hypothetical protein